MSTTTALWQLSEVPQYRYRFCLERYIREFLLRHVDDAGTREVRIAYGNNVEKARMLMPECVQGVAGLAPNRNSMVFLNDFGDGKICLVLVVWISVHAERSTLSQIRKKI